MGHPRFHGEFCLVDGISNDHDILDFNGQLSGMEDVNLACLDKTDSSSHDS
jgi:hypothetical protein